MVFVEVWSSVRTCWLAERLMMSNKKAKADEVCCSRLRLRCLNLQMRPQLQQGGRSLLAPRTIALPSQLLHSKYQVTKPLLVFLNALDQVHLTLVILIRPLVKSCLR